MYKYIMYHTQINCHFYLLLDNLNRFKYEEKNITTSTSIRTRYFQRNFKHLISSSSPDRVMNGKRLAPQRQVRAVHTDPSSEDQRQILRILFPIRVADSGPPACHCAPCV